MTRTKSQPLEGDDADHTERRRAGIDDDLQQKRLFDWWATTLSVADDVEYPSVELVLEFTSKSSRKATTRNPEFGRRTRSNPRYSTYRRDSSAKCRKRSTKRQSI